MSVRKVLFALFALLLVAPACGTLAPAAATVNGQRIPEAEVEQELDAVRRDPNFRELVRRQGDSFRGEQRRNILSALIRQSVAEQEGRRLGVTVAEPQIQEYVEELTREVGGPERLQQLMDEAGIDMARVRVLAERQVREQELIRAVTRDLGVDEAEVRAFYEQNISAFEEVRLQRITVATEQEAEEILAELAADASFSQLARERSVDAAAQQGGDLGYVPASAVPPQLFEELERVPEGGAVGPHEGPEGYELYQLVDRRPQPLNEVRESIEDRLLQQDREQTFTTWLTERMQEARVVVNPKYGVFDPEQMRVVPSPQDIPE